MQIKKKENKRTPHCCRNSSKI